MKHFVHSFPLYSIFALVFYLFLFCILFSPFRKKTLILFSYPKTSNPQSSIHFNCLDSFRGIAALWIAIFHTWQWSRPSLDSTNQWLGIIQDGDKAVPVFVVLSGLLIYKSLKKIKEVSEIKEYISRRFFRIFPVYFIAVAVSLLMINYANSIPLSEYFVGEIFFLRSLNFPFYSIPQTWSLYVEVIFYAIMPVYVIASRRWPVLYALIGLLAFCMCSDVLVREFCLWKYFFFGIVSLEIIERFKIGELGSSSIALTGICIIFLDVYTYDYDSHIPYSFLIGLGTSLLIIGSVKSKILKTFFEILPLRIIGFISYSIFIWHSFLILFSYPIQFERNNSFFVYGEIPFMSSAGLFLGVIPALLSFSAISYLLIERPFLLRSGNKPLAYDSPDLQTG